ncbi:MAG: hypothetical protein ABSC94_06420 [Polyangiaceae bacterium]
MSRLKLCCALGALFGLLGGLGTGCGGSATGGLDENCTSPGSLLGTPTCNSGLVCNTGRSPATCQLPNTEGINERCSGDEDCLFGLWCNVLDGFVCAGPLPLGSTCTIVTSCGPSGACVEDVSSQARYCAAGGDAGEPCTGPAQNGCAAGLSCMKASIPICTATATSGSAPQDDASSHATTLDGASGVQMEDARASAVDMQDSPPGDDGNDAESSGEAANAEATTSPGGPSDSEPADATPASEAGPVDDAPSEVWPLEAGPFDGGPEAQSADASEADAGVPEAEPDDGSFLDGTALDALDASADDADASGGAADASDAGPADATL